jgi:hypothetical protein
MTRKYLGGRAGNRRAGYGIDGSTTVHSVDLSAPMPGLLILRVRWHGALHRYVESLVNFYMKNLHDRYLPEDIAVELADVKIIVANCVLIDTGAYRNQCNRLNVLRQLSLSYSQAVSGFRSMCNCDSVNFADQPVELKWLAKHIIGPD